MGRKRRYLESHATLLVLLTILSCDSFKEDFIAGKQVIFSTTEYYVLPGSSVVIDLESAIKQSYTNASLTISQNPLRGTLSQLGTLLLKYYPAHDFLDGNDQFVFSVLSNNEVIATETMTIFIKENIEELPCPLYAVEDKVYVRPGSTVSVKFLKNDRICGIGESPLQISIHLNPRFGESMLVGDSIIVYTAGPGYTGRDEFVYKISDSSGENFSYGIINISEWKMRFFTTPITATRSQIASMAPDVAEIFFVNDTTGYLGGYGIYKTTDGGVTWKDSYSVIPVSGQNHLAITDIYFLDADHGYASYVGRGPCGCGGEGGLLHTVDGGNTWEEVFEGINVLVRSIFFTSSTTGFVGITYKVDVDATQVFQSILKTDDGGLTWNNVFSNSAGFSTLNIQFADSKNGYAYDNRTMFKTIDGGESWKWAYENEHIMCAAVTAEDIISANFTFAGSPPNAEYDVWPFGTLSETSPSTMFRSQDGEALSPTRNLPYAIFAQGFSPSGDIGFAIGISAIEPSFDFPRSQILSIHKSVDKGATWTEFETTEPLYGYPWAIAVPSDTVAYVLGFREVIKLTRP